MTLIELYDNMLVHAQHYPIYSFRQIVKAFPKGGCYELPDGAVDIKSWIIVKLPIGNRL